MALIKVFFPKTKSGRLGRLFFALQKRIRNEGDGHGVTEIFKCVMVIEAKNRHRCQKIYSKMGKISRRKQKHSSLFIFFIFMLLVFNIGFLSPSFSQEKKKQEIKYDVAVTAISIAVSVQDKKGRHITGLTKDDFFVYENNEKKDITYFSYNFEAPLSLTILLDVSGSMALRDKLKESKDALDYLAKYLLNDRDEISLLIFADGKVEIAANFSEDKTDFFSILEKTEAYGQTALNDAVGVSPDFANMGNNEKRALLLITDGIENDSEYSPDQAIEVARRVDIPIYTIGYKIPYSEQYLKKYKHSEGLTTSGIVESLERFSEATGGTAYFIDKPLDLKNALRLVKQELSCQYILGYTSYTNPNNEYRKIAVMTKKRSYKVRTRKGYYIGKKKGT